jgi:hypothetical protein
VVEMQLYSYSVEFNIFSSQPFSYVCLIENQGRNEIGDNYAIIQTTSGIANKEGVNSFKRRFGAWGGGGDIYFSLTCVIKSQS